MACQLFRAKPLSEPMLPHHQLDPKEHISEKLYLKFKGFIQENALKYVIFNMAANVVSASMC